MEGRRPEVYSESFWDKEYISSQGYDRLLKHMNEGSSAVEVVCQILKKRIKADEEYSKALKKISKSTGNTGEIGTVKNSLDCMKIEFDKMAEDVSESVSLLNSISVEMQNFLKSQEAARKPLEAVLNKLAKEKSSQYTKVDEARRSYYLKSQEALNAKKTLQNAKNDISLSEKLFNKVSDSNQKAQNAASQAEKDYRHSVDILARVEAAWEREMSKYCKECERMDERRLEFLRENMWKMTNAISYRCCEIDERCEVVRDSLESVDVYSDIDAFVKRSSTGNERPLPVHFEPFRNN